MTPYFADEHLTVYHGDTREVMAQMDPESVHCVVTSPPYWGLRDYGESGQLGLEPTPEEYVANMVAVFREVRRVLRADGTVWLNLGDSYTGSGKGGNPDAGKQATNKGSQSIGVLYGKTGETARQAAVTNVSRRWTTEAGMLPKQLVGIPWRVAFALQADGWYLRSDIIWAKPNPMPESVTDRPTKSHEYIFLLSKSPRYFFDADAVREEAISGTDLGLLRGLGAGPADGVAWHAASIAKRQAEGVDSRTANPSGARNIRSVWTIATQPYPGAHFATFPRKLVEPCVKAGTSEKGVCPECGAPWVRVTVKSVEFTSGSGRAGNQPNGKNGSEYEQATSGTYDVRMGPSVHAETTGWRPSCAHDAEPVPAVVLDLFAGSGTTGIVAASLGRRAVLIDLSMEYLGQLMERNAQKPLGLFG